MYTGPIQTYWTTLSAFQIFQINYITSQCLIESKAPELYFLKFTQRFRNRLIDFFVFSTFNYSALINYFQNSCQLHLIEIKLLMNFRKRTCYLAVSRE